jgi:signal transduction histidine kinase
VGHEFVPGLRARGEFAAALERERLAADLHARVVPELRRAAASTAGSAPGADLRGALEDVETLMAERHSVVLEEFGLLAAIEWLAERTTARTGATVEIDVGDAVGTGRPPREVERAAFRIALLAMDNAARHAPGASISVSVASVSSHEVRLAVADDGPGIDPPAVEAARLDGHRGLSDMDAAARAVGGNVSVTGGADGVGTRVTFSWVGH